jgi:uroporphyrinogen-III synthase
VFLSSSKIFLFSKTPYPGVHHIPVLQITYLQPDIDFSLYDYIIATSKEVFSALNKIGSWKHLPVLAISDSTAEAVQEEGAKVLDTAQGYGEDAVRLIREKYPDLKALHPHAKVVAYDIETALKESGIFIDSVVVYETSCLADKAIQLPEDAVCIFTSPSSIACFEKLYEFSSKYKIVCIGETTRSALPEGVDAVVSEKTSVASCVKRAESLAV